MAFTYVSCQLFSSAQWRGSFSGYLSHMLHGLFFVLFFCNTQIETTDKKVHIFIDVDGGGSEDV